LYYVPRNLHFRPNIDSLLLSLLFVTTYLLYTLQEKVKH